MRTIAAHAQSANARQISASDEGAICTVHGRRVEPVPRAGDACWIGRVGPVEIEAVHVAPVRGRAGQTDGGTRPGAVNAEGNARVKNFDVARSIAGPAVDSVTLPIGPRRQVVAQVPRRSASRGQPLLTGDPGRTVPGVP